MSIGWGRSLTSLLSLRRRRGRLLTAGVVIALVAGSLFAPLTTGSAKAATYSPAPLLNVAIDGGDGIYSATGAQYASLQNLETQAVQNTLAEHGLPSSDAAAVQTWGRADAEAELWALIINAISTKACTSGQTPGQGCRTTDQQNAVDWLTSAYTQEAIQAAQDAGLEYVKYAGLSQSGFNSLMNSTPAPSESQIQNFLCGGGSCPVNFANYAGSAGSSCPSPATGNCVVYQGTAYTEGYCVYAPPSPFSTSDYSDQGNPDCSGPCPGAGAGASCTPFGPSYNDFVQWGAADVDNSLFDTPGYSSDATAIGDAAGFGIAAAAAVGALPFLVALTSGSAGVGAAYAGALFPYAVLAGTAGAVTAVAVAAAVTLAIAAAIVVGFYAYDLFTAANVPSQIANLIVDAMNGQDSSGNPIDLSSLLGNSTAMGGLFSLFVGATEPAPTDNSCDNSSGGGGLQVTGIGGGTATAPCLNATAIPSQSAADPTFDISVEGAAATPSATLTWFDTGSHNNDSAWVTGNWFVETSTSTATPTTTTSQALSINYTDWSGNEDTAWLEDTPSTGYEFVGYVDPSGSGSPPDPSTCQSDGTCFVSNSIEYIDQNGQKDSATLQPAPTPTVSGISVSANPVEGTAATLTADATAPAGESLTYDWAIQDKPLSGGTLSCTVNLSQCTIVPPPPVTVNTGSKNTLSYTFPTSGSFSVSVTATDTDGLTGTGSATANVADVNPTLTLDSGDSYSTVLGSTTSLTGDVVHTGGEDQENLTVDWGDGTSSDNPTGDTELTNASSGGLIGGIGTNGSYGTPAGDTNGLIDLPFTATHTYADPGTYTATVTVTDQASNTATKTVTETVQAPSATSLASAPTSPIYGQPATYTATVSSPDGGTPTGTVRFSDGTVSLGTVTLSSGVAILKTSELALGANSITASYSGDSNFTSSSTTLNQTVLAPTTATVTANAPGSLAYGQAVTWTVNVSSPDGTPTGTVNFYDGSVQIATRTLDGSGQASVSLPAAGDYLPLGAHEITAEYVSDGTFASSNSNEVSQTVVQAGTTTSVSSNVGSPVWGQRVTFTAQVAVQSPGGLDPSGTVNFLDGSTVICGNVTVGQPGEAATCSTSGLAVGSHSVTAVYSSDSSDFAGSTSAALAATVSKASDGVSLASSGFVSTSGQAVTFTATVTPAAPGAGTPTGTVSFYNGSKLLGTGTVNASGVATFQTASLAIGAQSITASYNGDGNFNAATSGAITQYVDMSLSSFRTLPSGAYNLTNTSLKGAFLAGQNLTGAGATGANLQGAVLLLGNLSGANLTDANLQGTNLSYAVLTGANLSGANLDGTNLTGANLAGANLTGANLNKVTWGNTTCPDNTSSAADGGTCLNNLSS